MRQDRISSAQAPAQNYEEVVAYVKPEDVALFGRSVTSPTKHIRFDGTHWRGLVRVRQQHYSVMWTQGQWWID
jgi:hypothetical protein